MATFDWLGRPYFCYRWYKINISSSTSGQKTGIPWARGLIQPGVQWEILLKYIWWSLRKTPDVSSGLPYTPVLRLHTCALTQKDVILCTLLPIKPQPHSPASVLLAPRKLAWTWVPCVHSVFSVAALKGETVGVGFVPSSSLALSYCSRFVMFLFETVFTHCSPDEVGTYRQSYFGLPNAGTTYMSYRTCLKFLSVCMSSFLSFLS